MLVTKDANHLAADPDRSVEHGRNAEGFKVIVRQAAGRRMRQYAVGNDGQFVGYGLKIGRTIRECSTERP